MRLCISLSLRVELNGVNNRTVIHDTHGRRLWTDGERGSEVGKSLRKTGGFFFRLCEMEIVNLVLRAKIC